MKRRDQAQIFINFFRLIYLWFSLFYFSQFENLKLEESLGCELFISKLKKFGIIVAGIHTTNLVVSLVKYKDIYMTQNRNKHRNVLTYAILLYGIYLVPLGISTVYGIADQNLLS